MPLSQNRASENKFEEPLSSIGAPELKTVLLSLDGAPEYCHNHKKPLQIENTPEVCTAGSRVEDWILTASVFCLVNGFLKRDST